LESCKTIQSRASLSGSEKKKVIFIFYELPEHNRAHATSGQHKNQLSRMLNAYAPDVQRKVTYVNETLLNVTIRKPHINESDMCMSRNYYVPTFFCEIHT
jgi:hypothetical protein